MLTQLRINYLLDELCTRLGFCLPFEARERFCQTPPATADAFTDAVFVAEGLPHPDRRLRAQVHELVVRAFAAHPPDA